MFNSNFYESSRRLYSEYMGTESAAYFLYSMVHMLRPRNLLEVGAGYTSLFLAKAIHDLSMSKDEWIKRQENESDEEIVVSKNYSFEDEEFKLFIIDSFNDERSKCMLVQQEIKKLGYSDLVSFIADDFRSTHSSIPELDFIWFDCGGPRDYIDFFNLYWPKVSRTGALAFHMGAWPDPVWDRRSSTSRISPFTNELKKIQIQQGSDCDFEIITIKEPHKVWQDSITIVKKNGDIEVETEKECDEYIKDFGFEGVQPFIDVFS